jgi:hypothetical protein
VCVRVSSTAIETVSATDRGCLAGFLLEVPEVRVHPAPHRACLTGTIHGKRYREFPAVVVLELVGFDIPSAAMYNTAMYTRIASSFAPSDM